MKNNGIADFIKPTLMTGQQYGTKVSVEIDHSDTDIDELFEAFKTICIGLGYSESSWKNWIIDRAYDYNEEEIENTKDMGGYVSSDELRKSVNIFSDRDSEIFFNEIQNPSEPNEVLKKAVATYVAGLSEKEIDDALAQHNADEDADWDVTLNDGLEDETGWTDEMEKRYWEEQCPEPFATSEELNEFDDYGQRKVKKNEPKAKKSKKK